MKFITITRWVARIVSLLLAVFLILIAGMVLSGDKGIKSYVWADYVGFICFLCILAGLILSWPKEKLGIILSYIGTAGMIIVQLSMHERDAFNLLYLAAPATLLIICRLAAKK